MVRHKFTFSDGKVARTRIKQAGKVAKRDLNKVGKVARTRIKQAGKVAKK